MKEVKYRPFHETVIDAINKCGYPSGSLILTIMDLIRMTKIPIGHDEIIAALDKYWDFPGSRKWTKDIRLTKESILEQKGKDGLSKVQEAGKRNKQAKENLCHMFDMLARILAKGLVGGGYVERQLPMNVTFTYYPSTEYSFVLHGDSGVFNVLATISESDRPKDQLNEFSKLIEDGWLEAIATELNKESEQMEATTKRVSSIL